MSEYREERDGMMDFTCSEHMPCHVPEGAE